MKSYLFVPGHREDFCKKAHDRGADVVIWDMEDSVPELLRGDAMENVAKYRREGDHVRVGDEVTFHSRATIWYPKDVSQNHARPFVSMVESPADLLEISRPGFEANCVALAFGREDYAEQLGTFDTGCDAVKAAAIQMLVVARSQGVEAIMAHCASTDRHDCITDYAWAESQGFDGKMAIHPDQVGLSSSHNEVTAEQILGCYQEGCYRVGKRVIGPPMVKLAKRLSGC